MSVFIIAEIGINHNGDLDIAKKLIDAAVFAGCDAVKFQKRTVELCYSKEMLDSPRESPWGKTQRDQKNGLEFGFDEYCQIDDYCKAKKIAWSASAWDIEAQAFLKQFDLPFNKVASAMLTNRDIIQMVADERRKTFISTGMSTVDEIVGALTEFTMKKCPFELMACTSTYPMKDSDANLRRIPILRDAFSVPVGWSGHETGIQITLAAVAMGAESVERHITLDRIMYGSDQAASIEPMGLYRMVRDIRIIENAFGSGIVDPIEAEIAVRKKLRGY